MSFDVVRTLGRGVNERRWESTAVGDGKLEPCGGGALVVWCGVVGEPNEHRRYTVIDRSQYREHRERSRQKKIDTHLG